MLESQQCGHRSWGELRPTIPSSPWLTVFCRSALLEGTVILKIGPDRFKYSIHKALLVYHSEYFRKALEGPWKEAEEGTFNLEDIEPDGGACF